MQNQFVYNSSKDWEAPNKQIIFFTRMTGIFVVIIGIGYFIPSGWHVETWEKVLGIVSIAAGILQMTFPLKMLRPRGIMQNEFVIIDNDMIKWKQGRFKNATEIKTDEIESLSVFIGEIHFKSKNGETLKLKSYKIHNVKKLEEFNIIIHGRFQDKI